MGISSLKTEQEKVDIASCQSNQLLSPMMTARPSTSCLKQVEELLLPFAVCLCLWVCLWSFHLNRLPRNHYKHTFPLQFFMNLPKKYLSYSAISLWQRNKDEYRRRYYENIKSPETPEMIYGKKIAKILESGLFDDHPKLRKIPRYRSPEHPLEVTIDDIPLLGYVDSFDPGLGRFIEYKTGRNNVDGTDRWNTIEVYKTDQLPMYSLMVKEKYGYVENLCHLVWLRTVFTQKVTEFDGHRLVAEEKNVTLEGYFKIFPRRIFEYERQAMKDKIIRIAKEIETDYGAYQRTKSLVLPGAAEAVLG